MGAIIIIFYLAFSIQLIFYVFVFTKIIRYQNNKKSASNAKIPVSVIICAKNEEKNLKRHLKSILSQNYPEFEVIVVNDASTDNSSKILADFEKIYTHLHVIDIDVNEKRELQGKKHAVQKGIEKAKHNYMLFTDADCEAKSDKWISCFAEAFEKGADVVIGYSPFKKQKTWLNALIQIDTFFIGLQYFSLGLLGIKYMAVGRNMGYTKAYFNAINGFEKIGKHISGDDDLIIQKAKKNIKIEYIMTPESFMLSKPQTNIWAWLKQKKRHLSTSTKYKFGHQVILGLYPISLLLMYLCIPLMPNSIIIIGLLGFRIILQQIIFFYAGKKLQTSSMLLSSLIWDFIYSLIYFILAPYYFINKPNNWK